MTEQSYDHPVTIPKGVAYLPKQTFFNLPEAKRQLLIDIALDEFAEQDFQNASISRIVSRAGIAKGSLYQYFEDKTDLYMYLLSLVGDEKQRFIASLQPPQPSMSIFDYIRWLTESTVRFRLTHPKLDRLVYRAFYQDRSANILAVEHMKKAAGQYWHQLVEGAIARGDIDPAYDRDLVVWLFTTVTSEVGPYLMKRMQDDLGETAPEVITEEYTRAAVPLFTQLMAILERGLGPR